MPFFVLDIVHEEPCHYDMCTISGVTVIMSPTLHVAVCIWHVCAQRGMRHANGIADGQRYVGDLGSHVTEVNFMVDLVAILMVEI